MGSPVMPPLPPGFVPDDQAQSLPAGFVLDGADSAANSAPSVFDPPRSYAERARAAAGSVMDTAGSFVGGVAKTANPVAIVGGLVDAALNPKAAVTGIAEAHGRTLDKAAQSFKSGSPLEYLQGVRHALNTFIPLLGPALDDSQDKVRSGDLNTAAEGAGEIVGMAAAPKVMQGTAKLAKAGARAAVSAPAMVKDFAKGAAARTVSAATNGVIPPSVVRGVGGEIYDRLQPKPAAEAAPLPPPSAPPVPAIPDQPIPLKPQGQAPAPMQASPAAAPWTPAPLSDRMAGLSPNIREAIMRRRAAAAEPMPAEPAPPVSAEAAAPAPVAAPEAPVTATTIKQARARVKAADAATFDARVKKLLQASRKIPTPDEARAAAGEAPLETAPAKVKGPVKAVEPTDAELNAQLQASLDAVNAKKGVASAPTNGTEPVPGGVAAPGAVEPAPAPKPGYVPLDRLRAATFADQTVSPGKLKTSGRAKGQGGAGRNYGVERETVDALIAKDPYDAARVKRNREVIFSPEAAAKAAEPEAVAAAPAAEARDFQAAFKGNQDGYRNIKTRFEKVFGKDRQAEAEQLAFDVAKADGLERPELKHLAEAQQYVSAVEGVNGYDLSGNTVPVGKFKSGKDWLQFLADGKYIDSPARGSGPLYVERSRKILGLDPLPEKAPSPIPAASEKIRAARRRAKN